MNNNGKGRSRTERFDFIIKAEDDHVSISRPVNCEDVDRVRRQLAEWASRHPTQAV